MTRADSRLVLEVGMTGDKYKWENEYFKKRNYDRLAVRSSGV